MNMLIALFFYAFLALFIYFFRHILELIRLLRFSATIPGPSVADVIESSKKGDSLDWVRCLHNKYGPIFRIWYGRDLTVFFTDPQVIRQILNNNTLLMKSNNYKFVEPWLGKGLLTSGGAEWHRRRKLLTPAFHFKILSQFKEPIEKNCDILISKLQNKADGRPFDICPYLTLFALDVICETAMGIKKNAQLHSNSEYIKAVNGICRLLHKQSFSFWQRLNIFYRYTSDARKRDAHLKVLHGETERLIELRRAMLKKSNIFDSKVSDDMETEKRRYAFLDMLLIGQMDGNGLTDHEIREEVDTFMFEGHDTTSSAIAFTIYLLSIHPKIQQTAYEEALTLEDTEKETMPFLEAVIKESLRLYPTAPRFYRKVHEDLTLDTITVPKGTTIGIPVFLLHRDEKYFLEPDKFKPERFLERENNLHPYTYLPFSAGPRNCIGQKFGMFEAKCCVSKILRSFEILPVENYEPKAIADIIMKSENGIQIRMIPRK